MTIIQSGIDSTVATVDPSLKALYVTPKGTGTVKFSHKDFTLDSFERS
jgi:hypothetical protein